MVLTSERKGAIIKDHQRKQADTGSPEVQVALLSARIDGLSEHFKTHAHDIHSRQGLLRLINKRRELLKYLKSTQPDTYQGLITKLGLRK
ncbi:MAG: 30S ribosomal protein S15 [Chromatiales bacterium]